MEHVLPAGDYDLAIYVDDGLLLATAEHGGAALARYLELCGQLRLPISTEKLAEDKAATAGAAPNGKGSVVHFLGLDLDIGDAEELRLSPKRLEALRERCRAMRGRRVVSRKQFDSLVGMLSFCADAMGGDARVYLRSLYSAQRRRGRLVRITRPMLLDLLWFCEFSERFNGVSLMLDSRVLDAAEELTLFTDASLTGVAVTYILPDGTAEVYSARWDELLPGIDTSQASGLWHVSELEALGVLIAAEIFHDHERGSFAGRRVAFRVDNESTVTALNRRRGARDPGMQVCLRALSMRQQLSSFQVRANWIDTKANWPSDYPSRWTLDDGTRDVAVEREFYARMASQFGVARADVTEVPCPLDVGAVLRRMRKAHGGKVHRLNTSGGGECA